MLGGIFRKLLGQILKTMLTLITKLLMKNLKFDYETGTINNFNPKKSMNNIYRIMAIIIAFSCSLEMKAQSEADIMRIMDKNSYPNYNKDLATLLRIDTLYNYEKYNVRPSMAVKIKNLEWAKGEIDRINKVYDEYWKVFSSKMGKEEAMYSLSTKLYTPESNSRRASGFIVYFEIGLKNNSGDLFFPTQGILDKVIKQVTDNMALLNDTERDYYEKNDLAKTWWLVVNRDLDQADANISIMQYKKGQENEQVKSILNRMKETANEVNSKRIEFNAKMDALKTTTAQAEKIPVDLYQGADRTNLITNIKKQVNNEKVIKVILPDAKWETHKGIQDGTSYHYLVMNIYVITQDPESSVFAFKNFGTFTTSPKKDFENGVLEFTPGSYGPHYILIKNLK